MPERTQHRRLLVTALLAALAGCAVLGIRGSAPSGFSHRVHVDGAQLACTTCHPGAESGEIAGLPTLDLCRRCHAEDQEASLPPEARLEALLGKAHDDWATRGSRFGDDVMFSHARHRTAGLPCEGCHGDARQLGAGSVPTRIGKPECLSCHAGANAECSVCHETISESWPPPNHSLGWMTQHGRIARAGATEDFTEQCSLCHRESKCVACHLAEAPANHTNFWRQRGHSIEARIDRERCETCHQSDFCNRCHQETEPRSHRGAWGSPRNRHCIDCHLTGTRECALCHRGTPSHLLAAPMPPGHTPALNCRQCHGLGAPLPHVDNGDECTACHF